MQNGRIVTIIAVVVGAYLLFDWWKCSNAPVAAWQGSVGQSGCGMWAGSESPAYMMTSADADISVWGVPEEKTSCPGSPAKMGGGSSEGCHCN